MIERLKHESAGLNSLLRVGALVFLLGGALDLLVHAWPLASGGTLPLAEGRIHLVIIAGMVAVVVGLLYQGCWAARTARRGQDAGKEATTANQPAH